MSNRAQSGLLCASCPQGGSHSLPPSWPAPGSCRSPHPCLQPRHLGSEELGQEAVKRGFSFGGSGDWHCLWGGSGVSASQGLPTARGTRCPPFTPSASPGVSPGVFLSLWRCRGSGAGGGCRGLAPGAWSRFGEREGCACSSPSCLAEERHSQLPAGCGGRTRSETFPQAGSEARVTACLQPWPDLPTEAIGCWGCLRTPGVSLRGASVWSPLCGGVCQA